MTFDAEFHSKFPRQHMRGVENCKRLIVERVQNKLEREGFLKQKLEKENKCYYSSSVLNKK